ncbi:MAG: signal peptidase I [Actinomycetes bacterium]
MTLPEENAPESSTSRMRWSAAREVGIILIVALVLSSLVRTFAFQAFWIPSGSMENTLLPEDRILVSKLSTEFGDVKRGQVIVFSDPTDWLSGGFNAGNVFQRGARSTLSFVGLAASPSDRDLVKRVIGVGSDHVVCCDPSGRVSVNGKALDEKSYIFPGDTPSDEPFDVTVPQGQLWVMGDHRSASGDSRYHQNDPGGPFVPVSKVIGRGVWVGWPLSRWSLVRVPETFSQIPAPKK